VLSGSADYAAAGGSGQVSVDKTLEVNARSRSAKLRPLKESDRAHWRKKLEVP
jgi:hypothetical protein